MGGSGVGVGVVGRPISNLKTHYSKLNLSAWTCCRGARGSRYVSCGSEFVERARARVRLQANCEEVMSLLQADLPRLFEEEGIDQDMYEKNVQFRDPITKHDTLQGYLFNIRLLRLLFRPLFLLHSLRQTGPNEITTRWTMVMTFGLLPWKPQLVFTGTSVMGLNPQTGKFCSHVDYWDSIKQNDYFSFEGFMDVVKQLCILKTPDLETPKYWILKRTADYEVRKYESFVVIETKCDKLTGLSGFDNVIGYIFGKNTKEEKIPMTTPIFTQTMDPSQVHIQLVLPLESTILELPEPLLEGLQLRRIQENIVAVAKLSDKATEKIVYEKEKDLRASLIRDGIQPKPGCMLARYNDPNSTWNFIMFCRLRIEKEQLS